MKVQKYEKCGENEVKTILRKCERDKDALWVLIDEFKVFINYVINYINMANTHASLLGGITMTELLFSDSLVVSSFKVMAYNENG